MKKITIISVVFLLIATCTSINSIGQELLKVDKKAFRHERKGFGEAWNAISAGDELFVMGEAGAFRAALNHYLVAYAYNSNNPELNYKIGVCYLFASNKAKSLDYLNKAYSANPQLAEDIYFMKAWGLQMNYEFDEAIKFFKHYKKNTEDSKKSKKRKPKKGQKMIELDPDKHILECEIGRKLVANPIRVFIDNVGPAINSKYPDYGPIISADESVMIFCSRREGSTGGEIDPNDLQAYEDLYISHFDPNTGWSQAVNLRNLNTPGHDATVALSPDGQTLFMYRGVPVGTIFESKLLGDNWSRPRELGRNINSKYQETSASISFDGKKLYFVSERPRDDFGNPNLGGKDIFVSELDDKGRWGPVRNLGAPINTKYDEEGVFMHPDGRTMYFSSKGNGSMGGYDIFYTTNDGAGNWSEPVNIGYPVNTPDDDVFFVVAGNARYAYYSSDRTGGYGLQDIYRITFLGPEKLMAYGSEDNLIASSKTTIIQKIEPEKVEVRTVRLTILKGVVTDALSEEPIEAVIEIFDNEKDELVSTMNSNSKTGRYLVSLPSGRNYGISVKAEGYLFFSENFDIPETTTYQEVTKDVVLSKVGIGSRIVLRNIFFDYGQATLRETSFSELNRLVGLMKAYPRMKIEIGGHTDNHGSLSFNTKLSEDRAKSVVDYLIDNGISKDRLAYKGYAFTEPIATNDTDEGRQQNRRVEFKVISIN